MVKLVRLIEEKGSKVFVRGPNYKIKYIITIKNKKFWTQGGLGQAPLRSSPESVAELG